MTARFVVTLVEPCQKCNGSGTMVNSEYACIRCLGMKHDRTDVLLTDALRALGVRFVDTTETKR